MDENGVNTEKKQDAKAPSKKAKHAPVKKSRKQILASVYGEFKGEFKKIVWPSRKDLIKETTTVIITSVIFGVIICGMDAILGLGYDLLMRLVG